MFRTIITMGMILFFSCVDGNLTLVQNNSPIKLPNDAKILDIAVVQDGLQDKHFYFIAKISNEFISDLITDRYPEYSDWRSGSVPPDVSFGISFGEGLHVDEYGKGQIFGSNELVELLKSQVRYYHAKGTLLGEPYELELAFITKDNKLYYFKGNS